MSTTATPRPPTRKQVLTDMRRREILAAAIKVFGKKGFAATCVGDVADAAKIAKGTVYLYFDSKEEIYASAVQIAIAQLNEIVAERLRSVRGVREKLSVAIAVRMEFWHKQLDLYKLLLTVGRETRHKRQTNELLLSGHANFLSILEEGEAAAELPPRSSRLPDLDTIAWAILDMIRGCNERRLNNLTSRTTQQDAAVITAFTLQLLGLDPDTA